jgi:hypothetical protein
MVTIGGDFALVIGKLNIENCSLNAEIFAAVKPKQMLTFLRIFSEGFSQ